MLGSVRCFEESGKDRGSVALWRPGGHERNFSGGRSAVRGNPPST
jgi:hypothetical protein